MSVKYIAVKFLAVSLLKPPPGPRSGKKKTVGALDTIVFRNGDDGRGYRNMYKVAGVSEPNLGH